MKAAGFLLCGAFVASAWAQPVLPPSADPAAAQRRSIELEQRLREGDRAPTEQRPVERQVTKPAPPRPDAPQVRFHVRRIEFTPSEILSREELASVAREFEGRELTLAEVQTVVARVNALYEQKGIATAQATLPAQDVTAGIVRVRLVEGRVGKLTIQGNASTDGAYVEDRLALKPADLVDLAVLEQDLIRFNRTNDAQLRASLTPGGKFGETDLHIDVNEPPQYDLRFVLDNGGSESTGVERFSMLYLNRSLLGRRDALSLTNVASSGHSGQGFNYGLPLNRAGTRLTLGYNIDRTQVKNGPFRTLNISGRSTGYSMQLRHPLALAARAQVDGVVGATKRRSVSWIDSVVLQSNDLRNLSVGLDAQWVGEGQYFLGSLNAVQGTSTTPFTSPSGYSLWRGNLRHAYELGGGWSTSASFSFQASDDQLLPSGEQFLIGGDGSVRGYQTGLFSGDAGYIVTAELHHVMPGMESQRFRVTGFLFVDHGVVRPFRPIDSTRGRDELTSTGLGFNFAIDKTVTARLAFGFGLRETLAERRNSYVHLQVIAALF